MTTGNIQKKQNQIKLVFSTTDKEIEFNADRLIEELGLEVQAFIASAGMAIMQQIMEEEVKHRTGGGAKHSRHENGIDRWGSQPGYVILPDGQKVTMQRPRLRNHKEGKEVPLESYRRFHQAIERTKAVYRRLIAGISTRKYAAAIETIRDGYGISKSAISREMVEATSEKLQEFCERPLDGFDLTVLVIDGIHLGHMVYITAMGIDSGGCKHILGFQEGATENGLVCISLLEDLAKRGLIMEGKPVLCIIDGARALTAAVERFFGPWAFIQRCQIHKRRNVLARLPEKYHEEIREKIEAAYAMRNCTDTQAALESIIRQVRPISQSAANSLTEGLEETLTVHRLGLPPLLRTSLRSTNMIESMFSNHRHLMHNVRRWTTSDQRPRWLATCFLEAEKTFSKIQGYRAIPVLINAMEHELIEHGVIKRPNMA